MKYGNVSSKYFFKDENYNDYFFVKHSKCTCPYCDSLLGFFCLNPKEFEKTMIIQITKTQKENEIYNETFIAIFQYIFDMTFEEDGLFVYNNVIPMIVDLMIDDGFNSKLKIPIFLYINHLLLYEKGFSNLLLSMDFFAFHEHFLNSFMQNFNLESFGFFKKVFSTTKKISHQLESNEPKEETDEKILKSVSRKKTNKNFTKVLSENNKKEDLDHVNKFMIIPGLLWNVDNKKFQKTDKEVNEMTFVQMQTEEKDQVVGKYSKFFWKLHALYHLFKILQDFLKTYQNHSKEFIQQQFKDFIFQIIETTIIFNKYNDKYLPTEPFHVDTECWNEIRNILAEIMVFFPFFSVDIIEKIKIGDFTSNSIETHFKIFILFQYVFQNSLHFFF